MKKNKVHYEIRIKHKGGRNSSWVSEQPTVSKVVEYCERNKDFFKKYHGYKVIKVTTVREEVVLE